MFFAIWLLRYKNTKLLCEEQKYLEKNADFRTIFSNFAV